MTDKGYAALEETYGRQVAWVNDLAIGLGGPQLDVVLKTLAAVRARLEISRR